MKRLQQMLVRVQGFSLDVMRITRREQDMDKIDANSGIFFAQFPV
jgi:hypothetical protein